MDKTISDSLELLGLDSLSVKFLLAAYKSAPAGIAEIASLAHIKRSTAYLLAKELTQNGYLLEDHKKYKNHVYPIDPDQLLKKVSACQRLLRRQELELEENLPQIRSLYQASQIRPRVNLYEGNNGLLQVWRDILSAKSEILLWTNQQTENQVFSEDNHIKFITQRLEKNLKIRVLATDSPKSRQLQAVDNTNLRQTKILPKSTNFSAETYIYDNKIAVLDYNQDIIGIIIESVPIATSHKAIFETTWHLI